MMKLKLAASALGVIAVLVMSIVVSSKNSASVVSFKLVAGPTATPRPAAKRNTAKKSGRDLVLTDGEFDGVEIIKNDAEWKRVLSPNEFYIMRQDGTELPHSGKLTNNKKAGIYHCAACGLALFSSKAKFESDTGWPSFFQPVYQKNVTEKPDRTLDEERTEVECARCHAHLGHVFDDGPQPTGLRYCLNSVSLKFKPAK